MTSIGNVDEHHEAAVARTGLHDFGDPGYLEPMQVLIDSYRHEAGLTEAGARKANMMLAAVLDTKLRLQRAYVQWPQAATAPVKRPIILTGLPRTGTTVLHRLLAVHPQSQGMEHWLTEAPQPRPPRSAWTENADYQRMKQVIDRRHAEVPDLKGIHYLSPDTVEECWRAERLSFRSAAFESTEHIPTYSQWLQGHDRLPAYESHRDMLRVIGLDDPDRRWVLKSPSHLHGLDALMAVYPDAVVIQTHRHPHTIVASVSSLVYRAGIGMSTVFTGAQAGRDSLDLWSRGAQRFMQARRSYDQAQFIDVYYDDFVADPVGAVTGIFDQLGLPVDDDVRAAVSSRHEQSTSSDSRPAHHYALADFGLTEADVDARFANYLDAHFPASGPGLSRPNPFSGIDPTRPCAAVRA